MNIFFIPSWYPSLDHPISGIFIRDQVDGLTGCFPNLNTGISLWGQKDESTLLYLGDPLKSFKKIIRRNKLKKEVHQLKKNWATYYTPAFTWSKAFFNGNLKSILKANCYNFQLFEKHYGKVQLIHAFVTFPGGYVAMKLAEKYNIPYIITEEMSPFRANVFMNMPWKIEEQVLFPLKRASSVIAVSPFSAKQIESNVDISVEAIPNMVNEDFFCPLTNPSSKDRFTFFTLGRMVEQKGIPTLLEAISKLKHKNVLFKIGGEGEGFEQYKSLGKALALDNIEWLGGLDRNEAKEEFQKCDAFVLPSLHESMGVVFAEAIACGKPIIATKCGGPEYIINENNGLMAKVGDSDDLAEKMDWMIRNHNAYDAGTIREDFMKRFSRPVVCGQIMDVYKKVLFSQTM